MNLQVVLIGLILLLALVETPLFTVIAGLSMVCFYFGSHDWLSIQLVLIAMNRLASMPVLVALPLFTFVGCLLTETGAPRRIMDFVEAVAGWLPGGLGITALATCAFFTALTGASGVTIVALGTVLYPILRERHYGEPFTLGLLTTSGSLGLLFPPSLPVILYGVVAGVDIAGIYRAALIPGILLVAILSLYAFFYVLGAKDPKLKERHRPSFKRIRETFLAGIWEWPVIGIILVGVYGGYVTIAEVSALVLVYVTVVACLVRKEVRIVGQLPEIIVESVLLSGAIIVILGVALGFTGFLVQAQIPEKILGVLTSVTHNRYVFLAGLNCFLLMVGCVMDIFSAIVIVVPIIVPVAMKYGINPVHLCVIFLVNLEIGYATPPVGINLFIASLKFNKPLAVLYRASVPYLLMLLLALAVITYVPAISLCLLH